jgi:pilus assembly protein FimV
MVAKRSSLALALLLALPSAALALGLGDIRLLSPLNSPLDAEIDLVDVAPDEVNTVQAQLASPETFARYGLDRGAYLTTMQVRIVRKPGGRQVITVKSTDPISEPFVTVLLEVDWARGRLVREYTMLLDPPLYTPGQSALANAPVAAPAAGASAREGEIPRAAETPPAAPAAASAPPPERPPAAVSAPAAAAAPQPEATAAGEPASATPAPEPAPAARSEAALPSPAASSAESEGTHVVRRGESLSHIAAAAARADATSARGRSWMLAIYQANPRAFDQNMNLMRSGAVLRMPDAATVAAISPGEASAEIRRQYAAWRGAAPAPAEETAQPGRLKLVPPAEGATSATAAPSQSGEVKELQGRVQDLEGQLAESKRVLEMKNAELARMQAQLAAKQTAPAPAPAPMPPPQAAPPPVAAAPPPPPTAQAAPPPPAPAATEEKPPPAVEAPPPPPPAAAKPPTPAPQQKAPPPPSGGSLSDTLKGYWWVLLLLVLAGVGFVVARVLRARRASEFDDSLGRLAVAGADAADGGSGTMGGFGGTGRGPAPVADIPMRARPEPVSEAAFVVEETGTHERPRGAAATPAPTPRHVASDETISSETAINLDQGDPLAEADFHMAYGLYDQAADLIRIAISREPGRRDLKLKLLEVFFVWGNKEQFLQTARELAQSRADAAPGEWEKILIMGKQLAPEDPLFSGAGAVTGAAAGGVDLDLEGGQSRVDFDLLGEPAGADAPQGVDLDIGSAVGDHDVQEATTSERPGITDSNAVLENTFSSTTGTTRQMTQRVRPDSGGTTAEMEGPTVEQPALSNAGAPTVRQKVETALRKGAGTDQTAELAIDDLGLDVGSVDTVDQPGPAAAASSTPDSPTLVAGLDERSRKIMEDTERRAVKEEISASGAWQFDQNELEAALTQTNVALQDISATGRLAALKKHGIDVDVGDATGTHAATVTDVDLDVGAATGMHPANGAGLDLDVGTATVPDVAFAATQRLSSEDLALPDLEPVTMSEVGTKLDLARAYMDMGDPDGARNILEEVLNEGSAAQKQEAQRLMESLPG